MRVARRILLSRSARSKVAVASETMSVSNSRLPTILTVFETQWLVVRPTTKTVVLPARLKYCLEGVPMKPLLTVFQ